LTAAEWIRAFCEEIGTSPPSDEQVEAILRIAAIAAHSSERIAAPIACWAGGASGCSLEELLAAAEGLATGD
jgi:Domain of unknown function (DUF6457)